MFSVESLEYAVTRLYRGGIDEDYGYEAEDVDGMLNTICFPALLQAIRHKMEPVYAYTTKGDLPTSFNYRGPDLFGQNAVCLYVGFDQSTIEAVIISRRLELWLREDMTIAPVVCVALSLGNGRYKTEYRAIKECEPWESGMDLDLQELTDGLVEMCMPCFKHEQPVYEL